MESVEEVRGCGEALAMAVVPANRENKKVAFIGASNGGERSDDLAAGTEIGSPNGINIRSLL